MHAKLTLIWLQSLIEITILIINFVVAFAGAISSKRTNNNTINRHRDFSCFLDSGAAFIVTPLL